MTGRPPPPSPIGMETYTRHGIPWFELYDEERGDLPAPDELQKVEGVAPPPGAPAQEPVAITEDKVRRLRRPDR